MRCEIRNENVNGEPSAETFAFSFRTAHVVLLVALCGGCPAAPSATTTSETRPSQRAQEPAPRVDRRAPTALERGVFDRLARVAEAVRGLTFESPVPIEIHTERAIAEHLDAELSDDDLAKAARVYGALGLLPPDLDLRALLREVMSEQVVGYYDLEAHHLVVRDEIARGLVRDLGPSAAKTVIVHELVHGLQDQRLGFGELSLREHDSDVDNVIKSLSEGDATLAMLVYQAREMQVEVADLLEHESFDNLRDLRVPASPDALGRSPAILRYTLIVPYVAGLQWVRALSRDGADWTSVNDAYRTLPVSMEQVLHPRRHQRGEEPDALALPTFESFDAWELIEEDTLGELELGVFLARGSSGLDDYDRAAAEGWSGDRLRVYARGDATCAIWVTVWDDAREAREAERAARRDETQKVEREGRAVLILRNVPDELQTEPRAAFQALAAALPEAPPRSVSTAEP